MGPRKPPTSIQLPAKPNVYFLSELSNSSQSATLPGSRRSATAHFGHWHTAFDFSKAAGSPTEPELREFLVGPRQQQTIEYRFGFALDCHLERLST